MPFAERDGSGGIVALYASVQPSKPPMTNLADDHPDVIRFNTPPKDPTNDERMDGRFAGDPLFRATINQIALARGIPSAQVIAEMKAEINTPAPVQPGPPV
jgi:hypothetical protein